MTTIAVIGLGVMGLPMAANLVRAGHEVIGFNRSPDRVEKLVALGGTRAESIQDAVRRSEHVITVLPDSADVQAVTSSPGGLFDSAAPGTVWMDASTIRPDVSVALSEEARARGLRPLDTPVSGGEQGAIDATLSIMVGGAEDDFEAAREILSALGTTVIHVGASGSGQTVKAANQLIVGGTIQLVAEALVFLKAHDVDPGRAIPALAGGLAGSAVLSRKAETMSGGLFSPGFRVDLHHKDMGIVVAAAREAGVVIPVGALVAQFFASLRAQGHGSLDHSALMLLVEQLAGRPS
jgi:2-hydroxy-3-oxopropionate reductase